MVSVMLCPCILCVALLVYLFVLCVACLTVFVNCLVIQVCKHIKHTNAIRVQNTTLNSDGTTHNKQHRSKGVQTNGALDTINTHTLIRELLQNNMPSTIIKFIANYIKGHKTYTTYRNHTSRQRQFKTGVPQGGVLSPTLLNIYTAGISPPSAPVQVMAYADDITITSTHTNTSAYSRHTCRYHHNSGIQAHP